MPPSPPAPKPKQWVFAQPADSLTTARTTAWAKELEVSPLLTSLLWQRGLRSRADMDAFLSPGLKHLEHPSTVPGLEKAAQVLADALIAGKKPAVWGDYDVDGVTATAVVLDVLSGRGFEPVFHLPERRTEGYGLNIQGVERLAGQGVNLLLTVDCGISDLEAVARARELDMTVVVSDHHLPGEDLPDAHAVVNPRLDDCPCPALAGVGVAFLLMAAVNKLLPGEPMDMRQVLDLVALGTLADVVDLNGQNRILVKNGLLLVSEAKRPGIRALKESAGFLPSGSVTAGKVSFGLAPRINAAGRMGSAETALRLLRATELTPARSLAAELESLNEQRKTEEERITAEALEQGQEQTETRSGVVVHGQDWHPGVLGIVASRVTEALYKPTLVLSLENGLLKGSARSINEVDLYQALSGCAGLLEGFGGHRQAAGLSLKPERLDDLREAFHAAVEKQLTGDAPAPRLHLDADLKLSAIDLRLIKELDLLQPFGMGNPEPVFHCPRAEVRAQRTFAEKHVSLEVRDPATGVTFTAKAWRMAGRIPDKLKGRHVALAFTPKLSSFRGLDRIELQVKDVKVVE